MADDVTITEAETGTAIAADDIAGVKYQRVKVVWGVDGSAVDASASAPLPVVQTGTPALPTGAATAAKQPALGPAGTASSDVITVQGVSGMTSVKVDGSAVTQPVSAASLPLPTGASTAAKQPALGTAGTASTDVLTVQGIASMTALKVDGSAVTQPISAASLPLPTSAATDASLTETHGTKAAGTAAAKSELIGGLYNTTLPTLTNGQQAAIQVDSSGRILTSVAAIAAGSTIIGKVGIDQTTDGTTNKVVAKIVDSSGTALDYTVPSLVEGGTAHDSAMSTRKPVAIGGLAKTANPTAVADGDVTHTMHDKLGKVIAVSAVRDLKGVQNTTITSSTSETTIVTAVASTFLDLYGLVLANKSASATQVTLKDATAGTTRAVFYVPAGETRGFMLDAGSAIPQAAVNNNWTVTCGTSVDSLYVTALYVKNI